MIGMKQISGEIAALEEEKPTHVTMQKLASLYIVRDHMIIQNQPEDVAVSVHVMPDTGSETEFAKAVTGKSIEKVMSFMDELMSTLSVVNPKLYASAIRSAQNAL